MKNNIIKEFGEVFTPDWMVNEMLDSLPLELFKDKTKTFCDGAAGQGIFLKYIIERCMKYQEDDFNSEEERLSYILKNRIFANEIQLKNVMMLIHLLDNKTNDLLESGHIICADTLTGEYQDNTTFRGYCYYKNMFTCNQAKFDFWKEEGITIDVMIGNPPYNKGDGGFGPSSKAVYHKFIKIYNNYNPSYILQIIPARWYSDSAKGEGLTEFKKFMLSRTDIPVLVDYANSKDVFETVNVQGGICWFLKDKIYNNKTKFTSYLKKDNDWKHTDKIYLNTYGNDFFTRIKFSSIYDKIKKFNEKTYNNIVCENKPFGMRTYFDDYVDENEKDVVKCYGKSKVGYIKKENITKHRNLVYKYKVLVPEVCGNLQVFPVDVLTNLFVVDKNTCCTETYNVIDSFDDKIQAENCCNYFKTKFVRFLLMIKKITFHTSRKVFRFVPLQDFNEEWTDEKLYKKYNLTSDEINYIEKLIKPMK